MRKELAHIDQWITAGSRVLDLGCGDGSVLAELKTRKNIYDCGVEINNERINACLAKGVNVIQQDIDQGLANFDDDSFDTILLTQTLQALKNPDMLVEEMLRVGKRCIISFPNFGFWRYRTYLMFQGRMPISPHLPATWYNTENIHFCTVNDFDDFCRNKDIKVLDRIVLDRNYERSFMIGLLPNFFGINAAYHISR